LQVKWFLSASDCDMKRKRSVVFENKRFWRRLCRMYCELRSLTFKAVGFSKQRREQWSVMEGWLGRRSYGNYESITFGINMNYIQMWHVLQRHTTQRLAPACSVQSFSCSRSWPASRGHGSTLPCLPG
jgi:hypothetical protein